MVEDCRFFVVVASSNSAWCQAAPSADRPCFAQSYARALSFAQRCMMGLRMSSQTLTILESSPGRASAAIWFRYKMNESRGDVSGPLACPLDGGEEIGYAFPWRF